MMAMGKAVRVKRCKRKVHNRRTVAGTPRVLRLEFLDKGIARVAVDILGTRNVSNACASFSHRGGERVDKIPKSSTLDDDALREEDANGGCRDALRLTPRAVGRVDGGDAHEGDAAATTQHMVKLPERR